MNFAAIQQIKIAETSELVLAGAIQLDRHRQLTHIVTSFYKHGNAAGGERLRLKVFHDRQMTKLYATSSWLNVNQITNEFWIGRIRFDFDQQWLRNDQAYYIGIESDGYTRNGESFYLGFPLDSTFDLTSYERAGAVAMAVYGHRLTSRTA